MAADGHGRAGGGPLSGRDAGRSEGSGRSRRRLLCLGKPFRRDARPEHWLRFASWRRVTSPPPETCLDSIAVRRIDPHRSSRTAVGSGGESQAHVGQRRHRDGDEVLEEAADLVDHHRILLSATEARAGVSLLADEIAGLGLEAIHENGLSAISWTERFRGASLRIAPVVMSPGHRARHRPGRAARHRP